MIPARLKSRTGGLPDTTRVFGGDRPESEEASLHQAHAKLTIFCLKASGGDCAIRRGRERSDGTK